MASKRFHKFKQEKEEFTYKAAVSRRLWKEVYIGEQVSLQANSRLLKALEVCK